LTRTSTTSPPNTAVLQTRLSVYAYLFFLPFQLNASLGWWTIPGEFIVSVVYLGFMAVGIDIGKPFQAGLARLDVGGLVEDLKRQIDEIAQTEVCQLPGPASQ
jgi:putative membrane protein